MQWVMSKLLHLRDCGSIPLSANQDTNQRTKLLVLGRKDTQKKGKQQQQQQQKHKRKIKVIAL